MRFGFIEHFSDFVIIVRRHAELVAPDGLIIITSPSFAGMQYLLRLIADYENLKRHNTSTMNLSSFKKAFSEPPFKIEMFRYYRTFGFWHENESSKRIADLFKRFFNRGGMLLTKLFGENFDNPLVSQCIVCVARKIAI